MIDRRGLLSALALAGFARSARAEIPARPTAVGVPPGAKVPSFSFLYECKVTLGRTLDFGRTLEGRRRVIPITGGVFEGPKLRGTVVNEGADWNLSRNDGAGSADAAYYLRTDDEVLIRIVNQGVSAPITAPDPASEERFLMYTHAAFEAPMGKYDWLNRGMFFGTLNVRRSLKNAVLIRVFQLV
ncbi:MAG: DUF3237 domain-containing protein [Steroidobacteraceae bacterium]